MHLSVTKNRQLGERPVASIAANDWPCRFPDGRMVVCSYVPDLQSGGDTNREWLLGRRAGAETENGVGDDIVRARASVGVASEVLV